MGSGSSSSSNSGSRDGGNTTSDAYFDGHPGLRNRPGRNRESEITDNVQPPDPNDSIAIKIKGVDLNGYTNTQEHHTDEFDGSMVKTLILRRGQPFDIDIEFNREYDDTRDKVRLLFTFGKHETTGRRSHIEIPLSERNSKKEWKAHVKSKSGYSIKVAVTSPPFCYVGKWALNIDVEKAEESRFSVERSKHLVDVYMLFNPWNKDDLVYMPEVEKLSEYVLNETGLIWVGSHDRMSTKPWDFGQFEEFDSSVVKGTVLDCALYLLEKSEMADSVRGDPIIVSRKISAIVNSSDDRGVVTGNWSGDYSSGTPPLDWNGSVDILQQYYKTKTPVRYGQCWVFSAVVTTICRALGIPCRSTTNFQSAHDTDVSITIDAYFDEKDMSTIRDLSTDSVWNFHVWNDAWMARPDLPPGYGGWQAIDATPQETSEGIFCLGPAPLQAIKKGEVYQPYDARFVFAEVNADELDWMLTKDYQYRLIDYKNRTIGKNISTKEWNSSKREDVTLQYKFAEGSSEEYAALTQANMYSAYPGLYQTDVKDVSFTLNVNPDTFVGDMVKLGLDILNTGSDDRTIEGRISVSSIYYTGVLKDTVSQRQVGTVTLKPNDSYIEEVEISERDYYDHLQDHCILKISVLCIANETGQTFSKVKTLRLRKPHLEIKGPTTGRIGEKFSFEVSFINPLSMSLTKCRMRVDGPGLGKPLLYKYRSVEPREKFTATYELTPLKKGKREIVLNFSSDQLLSINGSHKILIE